MATHIRDPYEALAAGVQPEDMIRIKVRGESEPRVVPFRGFSGNCVLVGQDQTEIRWEDTEVPGESEVSGGFEWLPENWQVAA